MAMQLGTGRATSWEIDHLKMTDQIITGYVIDVWPPPGKASIWVKCRLSHIPTARLLVPHSTRSPPATSQTSGSLGKVPIPK